MNKVILIGRLTKDPELRYTPGNGTAVTTLTLAVDNYNSKTGEKGADFIPVVIWGKQAENTAQYMIKGSQIAISGRITTRSYDAKDGTKRYVTEVVADMINGVSFLSKGNGNNSSTGNSNPGNDNNDAFGDMGFDSDMTPVDDGDMPF
ncbi:single-stranded DNA-binding protein [Clostridium sp. CAG:221]|uniref:single-stranded DNA-binding protein n=1 Tax=Clostridium sp. CAG:221 TaxID=1262780 RepID=UPI00033AB85C|nr:single-stranded DNA-binding protein [Clostridium sp. CAG:221]CDB14655.1 single-stranded DNA-binding protein [Clostridium sp. CAG:221]